jgi:hypothetical protein
VCQEGPPEQLVCEKGVSGVCCVRKRDRSRQAVEELRGPGPREGRWVRSEDRRV